VSAVTTPIVNRAEVRPTVDAEHCSIAGALDALGDVWSILVLRELFFGVHRFNDIQTDLGISRSVLTERLTRLVDAGVVRTHRYQDPGERARNEYRLTRKGVGLLPVMVALMKWGDEHVNDGRAPVSLHEKGTGDLVQLELRSTSGRIVPPNELEPHIHPVR
jgi:DNA-binding HxlR family transcriptional regulator